ncbi:MAG TPA: RluA family pseudouridine synthase [Burkholderiaceae bacterium]
MGLAVISTTTPKPDTDSLNNVTGDDGDALYEDAEDFELPAPQIDLAPVTLKLDPSMCGERLDKVVSKLIPQFSRSRLQLWIADGHMTVDGKVAKPKMTSYGDETVVVYPQPAPEDAAFKPEPMELDIVFEDDAILVVNKPAGLVVHPGAGNWAGTLLNGLLHRCPQLAGVPRAGIVHRLDKDTSGLMVVGKTLAAQTDLVRQLQARTVKREYFAMVWGTPQLTGTIDASMGRHPKERVKMAISSNFSAKPAITHYARIGTGFLEQRPVSLMRCNLETGRTHQIRVHMLSIGHALVGDSVYGKPHLMTYFPRQALQARRLGFNHPVTGEHCEWTVPLAADFAELVARAGMPEPE